MAKHKRGPCSTVVRHPNFAEIELAMANNVRVEVICERYGLSKDAVYRHKNRMTPERLTLLRYRTGDSPIDLERLKQGEAESVVQRNVLMLAELFQLYRLCVETGDFRTAVRAASEYRGFVECQAKIVGELVTGDRHLHLAITDSPQFKKLVALVMSWAANKPDLAAQLGAFLQEQEAIEAAALPRLVNGHDDATAVA